MTSSIKGSAKLAALLKKTAQKLVKNPKAIHKELKKLALTLPLMALLVEEVRAAQKKVTIDAAAVTGEVFEDETALAEFIDAQNLDAAQYTEIEQELDDVLLAKADQAEEEGGDKAAHIHHREPVIGEDHQFGDGGMSLQSEDRAAALVSQAEEPFVAAGLPIVPLPAFGGLLGAAAGVAAGAAVIANGQDGATDSPITAQAEGTNLTTSLKDLQKLGVDFVTPAAGQSTINVALGAGDALGGTAGIPLFGDTNRDGKISAEEDAATSVNLTITSAEQLAEVAALGNLASFGIDSVRIDLANQNLLNALVGDNTLATDLAAIRASGLTIDTIDMGSSAKITEAQAATLVSSGVDLHFAATHDITLEAAAGSTHLTTSLKDLQKLGVDVVSVAGLEAGDTFSVNMGGLTTTDLPPGSKLPKFDSALNVTLDVTDVDQFHQATQMSSQLLAANIDNVDITVAADADGFYAPAVAELSGNATLRADITTLAHAGVNPGLDFGGKDVVVDINFDAVSVTNLIADGLHFAANDHISMDVVGHSSSTHLSNSLKDLHKLGIDAVSITSEGVYVTDSVVVDSGGLTASDLTNGALLPQFDSALNVTLSVANPSEFNSSSQLATQLHDAHIDNVEVVLDVTDQYAFDTAFQSLINDASFTANVATLTNNGISTGIDLGGADVSTIVKIDEAIADGISALNLHYADNDFVIFDETLTATQTHLSTSIKDLHKLGVDAVTVTGSDNLHVTLGTSDINDFSPYSPLPFFDPLNPDLDVTLDVGHNAAQFGLAADIALALHTTHVDNVKFDVLDAGPTGFANDLLALATNTSFINDVDALKANMVGVELDLGGASTQGALSINEQQATALIAAGVHFSDADHITLNATGTFHQNHLADLHKLGVDTFEPHVTQSTQMASLSSALHDAGTAHLDAFDSQLNIDADLLSQLDSFDWSSNVGADLNDVLNMVAGGVDVLTDVRLDPQATWGDLIDTLQEAGLGNVELEATAKVHISDDLSAALYESGMLHALPDAAIAIDAGANKVLNTSLKAMADIGVDSVNTAHKVYVELGLSVEDAQTLADLGDVFSAFGLDSAAPDTHLFGTQGAGLVVDQATFDSFSGMDAASLQTLLGDLSKLGFTEVDVMGANAVSAVYEINITAQTPVLSQVALIGTDATNDLAHVFDPGILNKPVK